MSFSKATQLLQLARMASGRVGVTLYDIEREFECVRRTAQRMSQALEDVFPDTETYVDHEGRKRWRDDEDDGKIAWWRLAAVPGRNVD